MGNEKFAPHDVVLESSFAGPCCPCSQKAKRRVRELLSRLGSFQSSVLMVCGPVLSGSEKLSRPSLFRFWFSRLPSCEDACIGSYEECGDRFASFLLACFARANLALWSMYVSFRILDSFFPSLSLTPPDFGSRLMIRRLETEGTQFQSSSSLSFFPSPTHWRYCLDTVAYTCTLLVMYSQA